MKIPAFVLTDNDRIWLRTLYDISLTNKRPNLKEMKSQLKDQLPRSYDPASIPSDTIVYRKRPVPICARHQ